MKNIKQALYAATATALMAAPLAAGAALGYPTNPGTVAGSNLGTTGGKVGLSNATVYDLIGNVMNWLLGIIGVLAVVAFVISGILYLTAAGNEEQVEKAKGTMMYAIIGLVVALVGLIIVNAVMGITGGGGGVTTF